VKSYKVTYSNDGITWLEADGGKTFKGNKNQKAKVLRNFDTPFTARTIRIHPVTWKKHISMRFEAYYLEDLANSNPVAAL